MKRIMFIIIISIIISIPFITVVKYIHAKTIGKGNTDCMIEYVNNYYPYGSVYLINNKYPHIDKRGLEYLNEIKEINGCYINDGLVSFIFNSTYCYLSLFLEKNLFN